MSITNLIIIIIITILIGILYQKYIDKHAFGSETETYNSLQGYLLNESVLNKNNKKPIMWVHIPYEYNARHWQSFGSRSSSDLNQPYLYLTAKTIIKNCDKSFTICFKLYPNKLCS